MGLGIGAIVVFAFFESYHKTNTKMPRSPVKGLLGIDCLNV